MGCSDSKAGGAAGTASDTGGDAAVDRIEIDLQLSDSELISLFGKGVIVAVQEAFERDGGGDLAC